MDPSRPQPGSSRQPGGADGASRTVPQEAFSPEGLRAYSERTASAGGSVVPPEAPDAAAPRLARPGLSQRLHLPGQPSGEQPLSHFEIQRLLGVGATGRVYAVHDRNLERAVAVKFLSPAGDGDAGDREAIEHFIQEARITATLEHPNVLPVHELDVNDEGQVYFSMKKIEGASLGALIDRSSPAGRTPPLDDANALVSVFIDVCKALSYAHAQGIVHQDIKPENIMVGGFGEVLLVDWGSAIRIRPPGEVRLYGTPLYMSPEQARRERSDERSDVYGLGATLFHALMLRPPTWSDDAEDFWRMKRAGVIQPPSAGERSGAPALLVDIALKALAPEPAARYADAAEMLADLRRYQSGVAVSAHRDTWIEALARWHRRRWRALWGTVAVATVMLALGLALYGEKLKEIATWGSPEVEERFADDSWRQQWTSVVGSFAAQGGRLVSTSKGESDLVWPHKLWGPVAIEYEAEIPVGSQPGDISAFWARDLGDQPDKPLLGRYLFQVGAFDGAYTTIRDDEGRHLAFDYLRPEPGRRYRIRAEVDDYRLTLSVDGRVVCQWTDTVRFDGGYLGLYAVYGGKAFSDVRIYRRGVAQRLPATAIGDTIMRLTASSDPQLRGKLYDQAFEQYARVVESRPTKALEREALYKEGLCRWEQHRYDEANDAWRPLAGTDYGPQAELYRIDRRFTSDDHDGALAALEALYRAGDADLRRRVAMRWGHYIDALCAAKDAHAVERYLLAHDRSFNDEMVVDVNAAEALAYLRRYEELLRRYPRQRLECAVALGALGRSHEVIERYPDQVMEARHAMFVTGEFAMLERLAPESGFMDEVRVKADRAEEVLAGPSTNEVARWMALCALGREDEAMASATAMNRSLVARTLILFGREREAATMDEPFFSQQARLFMGEAAAVAASSAKGSLEQREADLLLGLDAYARGDAAEGHHHSDGVAARDWEVDAGVFIHLLLPVLEHPRDPANWAVAAAPVLADRWASEQVPWHAASYLQGGIDDAAFLAQPHRLHARARLLLLRALLADRAGRIDEALAGYRAYAAQPRWQHDLEPQPLTEAFARSRIAMLSAP
jgi:hypothetical protein